MKGACWVQLLEGLETSTKGLARTLAVPNNSKTGATQRLLNALAAMEVTRAKPTKTSASYKENFDSVHGVPRL